MTVIKHTKTELLISEISKMLDGLKHIAVGASSPIPGAAAFLARERSKLPVRISVLSNEKHNDFTEGNRELFDCAGQGRIDAFFLGGGQIDGHANVNLLGLGSHPDFNVRFPGSYGSAYLYFLVPRVILFRQEHSRRVLVPKVDFISAPGSSPENIYRPGGPYALITEKCIFSYDNQYKCFCLQSIHDGETISSVEKNTGFKFLHPEKILKTPPPSPENLELIRSTVWNNISEIYPGFTLT